MSGNHSSTALAVLRIITGVFLFYHGLEIFDAGVMGKYFSWEKIKSLPMHEEIVYLGKGIELVGGLLMAVGLFTRLASIACALVMLFICFYLGKGKFWYDDQHPFLLAMICTYIAFVGSGGLALSNFLEKKV